MSFRREAMRIPGAVQHARADPPPVFGRIPAEVAQIDGAFNRVDNA